MTTTTAQRLENRIEQARADGRREAIAEILAMAHFGASLWPEKEYRAGADDWVEAEGAVVRQTYRNFADLLTALRDADA